MNSRMRNRRALIAVLCGSAVSICLLFALSSYLAWIPEPPPASLPQSSEGADRREVRELVVELAEMIGPRNVEHPGSLGRAAQLIERRMVNAGLDVHLESWNVDGASVSNIVGERQGNLRPSRWIVVGAHYDSVGDSPGALDNATGVAVMLVVAERIRDPLERSIAFVGFANEEPPFYHTDEMGSRRFVRRLQESGKDVRAALILDMLGCFNSERVQGLPGSLLLGGRGDSVVMTANLRSHHHLRRVAGAFRSHSAFPIRALAGPAWLPYFNDSDHDSFWRVGLPAVFVSDTGPLRGCVTHVPEDNLSQVDLDATARLIPGLVAAVRALATSE